jgi:hypothetical protein
MDSLLWVLHVIEVHHYGSAYGLDGFGLYLWQFFFDVAKLLGAHMCGLADTFLHLLFFYLTSHT